MVKLFTLLLRAETTEYAHLPALWSTVQEYRNSTQSHHKSSWRGNDRPVGYSNVFLYTKNYSQRYTCSVDITALRRRRFWLLLACNGTGHSKWTFEHILRHSVLRSLHILWRARRLYMPCFSKITDCQRTHGRAPYHVTYVRAVRRCF